MWLTNGALFEATLQYVSEGRYGVLSTVPVNAAWRVLLVTFWPRVDCTLNHVTASWVIATGVPVKLWPSCAPTRAVTLDSNTIFPRQHPFFHCFRLTMFRPLPDIPDGPPHTRHAARKFRDHTELNRECQVVYSNEYNMRDIILAVLADIWATYRMIPFGERGRDLHES